MRALFRGAGLGAGQGTPAAAETDDAAREHCCAGLSDALERALAADTQPRVLDLGSRSGPTAVFLAGIGARVCVDLFDPPTGTTIDAAADVAPAPVVSPHAHLGADGTGTPVRVGATDDDRAGAGDEGHGTPLSIDHEDGSFDLVLAWDVIDFTPPARLAGLFAELARVLAPGGAAVLMARDTPHEAPGTIGPLRRFEVVAEDRVVSRRTEQRGPRWSHPSRKIEQALGPLAVRQMRLQRERVREYVVARPTRPVS